MRLFKKGGFHLLIVCAICCQTPEMFFRKKKYNLNDNDRDSSLGDHSDKNVSRTSDNGYTTQVSFGGSGETLSRKKEQRRITVLSQYGSSNPPDRNSHVHPQNQSVITPDSKTKPQISPIFGQEIPSYKTPSPENGLSKDLHQNGLHPQISSKDQSPVPDNSNNSNNITTTSNSDMNKNFNITSGNINNFPQQPNQRIPGIDSNRRRHSPPEGLPGLPPGPTNIDDVINFSRELNPSTTIAPSNISITSTTSKTSSTLGTSHVTDAPTETIRTTRYNVDNCNTSNVDNTNCINNIFETSSFLQSNTNPLPITSLDGQVEIKSLRQLRKSAPKFVAPARDDSSKLSFPSSSATTSHEYSSVSIQPATNDLSRSDSPEKIQVTSFPEISSPPQSSSSAFDHSSVPQSQPEVKLNPPGHSTHENESDVTVVSVTTPFPSDVATTCLVAVSTVDPVEATARTTDIDEVCNKYPMNSTTTSTTTTTSYSSSSLPSQNQADDKTPVRIDKTNMATKIFIGSGFMNRQLPVEKVETNVSESVEDGKETNEMEHNQHLQSNCVSRIIIKNDKIAITGVDDVIRKIPSVESANNSFQLHSTSDVPGRNLIGGGFEEVEDAGEVDGKTEAEVVKGGRVEGGVDEVDVSLDNVGVNNNDNDKIGTHSQTSTESSASEGVANNQEDVGGEGQHGRQHDNEHKTDEQSNRQRQSTVGKFKMIAGSLITTANGRNKSKDHKNNIPVDQRENNKEGEEEDNDGEVEEEEHEYFRRRRKEAIEGRDGSFRGFKNLVKSGISAFVNTQGTEMMKSLAERSKGRVTFFTTSMSVIRTTRDRCSEVKKILQNHRIYFDERDIYISDDNARDLVGRFRLGQQRESSGSQDPAQGGSNEHSKREYEEMLTKLPIVFVEDFNLGGYEEVFKLNETGVLKKIFEEFPKVEGDVTCPGCGGFRYTPCHGCHGSKRSRSNAFTEEFVALRCTKCDENGLARCKLCNADLTFGE